MIEKLTPREIEILNLIAKGIKSKEIADILFISTQTVKNHRYNILTKLKAKTMEHAIAMFYENKIKKMEEGV